MNLPRQCQVIRKSGAQCSGFAIEASEFCYMHHPAKSAERAEAQSRGGKARPGHSRAADSQRRLTRVNELVDSGLDGGRAVLMGVLADVETLDNTVDRARAIGYLLSVLLRLELVARLGNHPTQLRVLVTHSHDAEP